MKRADKYYSRLMAKKDKIEPIKRDIYADRKAAKRLSFEKTVELRRPTKSKQLTLFDLLKDIRD